MNNTDYKPTTIFDHATLEQALETIEDALCYGFELIVENHSILWRDTVCDNTSTID